MKRVVKISIMIYFFLGLLIGMGLFILSLYDSSKSFYVSTHEFKGIWAGTLAIITMPIIMAVVGLVHGIFFWFPITYIYKKVFKLIKK